MLTSHAGREVIINVIYDTNFVKIIMAFAV